MFFIRDGEVCPRETDAGALNLNVEIIHTASFVTLTGMPFVAKLSNQPGSPRQERSPDTGFGASPVPVSPCEPFVGDGDSPRRKV